MKMKIHALVHLGITSYTVRTVMDRYSENDPEYAWVKDALILRGAKRPLVDAEKFVDAYEQFREQSLKTEMMKIRERLQALEDSQGKEDLEGL
jgi:hypothetical protein